MVSSSSSQEVHFVNASVQTPNKFMKKAGNDNSNQAGGTSAEELRQIIEKVILAYYRL